MWRAAPLVILLAACGGDSQTINCPNDLPAGCSEPGPSYGINVAPLIMERCGPCHLPGGVEASTHNFSTYSGVAAQKSQILDQVHACNMPPTDATPMSSSERAIVFDWILCGAQNN